MFEPLQLSRPFSGNAEWKRFYREGDGFQRPKRTAREREKPPQKRERVISAHPASFLFTHKLSLSGLCPSLSSLFLYYPSRLNLALYYLFPFLFPSHHSSPPLIFSLTYCIYYGLARGEHTPEKVPPSRKFLQLEDKSILKRTERIPLTPGCLAPCSGTFNRPKGSCLRVDVYLPQMQVL